MRCDNGKARRLDYLIAIEGPVVYIVNYLIRKIYGKAWNTYNIAQPWHNLAISSLRIVRIDN